MNCVPTGGSLGRVEKRACKVERIAGYFEGNSIWRFFIKEDVR
jgi:hypothetical protein